MAYDNGIGPYSLMQSDKILFFPTTRYGIIPVPKFQKKSVICPKRFVSLLQLWTLMQTS